MSIADQVTATGETFSRIDPERLDGADTDFLDSLPFGVIGLSEVGLTEIYNVTEARYAGMQPQRVIGQPFFLMAGVCMNNYLIAQRFKDEEVIDATIDYILTFRMRPTPVKLRLLKKPGLLRNYLLVQR
ncbi:MAG: phosphonate transporter [Janthinobacterium lividum]